MNVLIILTLIANIVVTVYLTRRIEQVVLRGEDKPAFRRPLKMPRKSKAAEERDWQVLQ